MGAAHKKAAPLEPLANFSEVFACFSRGTRCASCAPGEMHEVFQGKKSNRGEFGGSEIDDPQISQIFVD